MGTNNSPKVMGIININRESFYEKSRCTTVDLFEQKIISMIDKGANIIDIGGCSTRPGSTPVSMEQEWEYLQEPLKVVAHIASEKSNLTPDKNIFALNGTKSTISIDTFNSEIVRRAYDIIGEFIVNDISAGEDDAQMLKTVGELNLPYIAMHKRGTPDTMQGLCDYPKGVVNEVIEYFKQFNDRALGHGIKDYIIDPGYGFAKTVEQNYELLQGIPQIKKELADYCGCERKLLVGISRKSMIWKPLNITPEEALPATVALNLQALILGGDIIRVHDVKEGVECVKILELLAKH